MPRQTPPVVLTIAGFDPSSGAGITADIKTIAAHGCYGISCITALTVQSTAGVRQVEPVRPELISATLAELIADVDVAAVHIGMLASAPSLRRWWNFWSATRLRTLSWTQFSVPHPGKICLDAAGRKLLKQKLIPLCTALTPNVDEAAVLTGLPVTEQEQMRAAAHALHKQELAPSS